MPHAPSKRPVRVLVVDDHADVRFLVRAILGDAGPDVAFAGEAAGAREAVDALESTDPDVVVLDARMPGIDGFEAAAAIRSLERSRRVPIIFLSAQGDRRADGRDAHSEFILKPVDPEVIRPRVAAHLERFGTKP
jgi:CheY-like chemotaxis protein